MEQAYKHTDLFLTHTWRTDLHGRDTHNRVRIVNEHLNRLGYLTWFDEKSMTGNIEAKMMEGIDYTRCCVVFVTEQYMTKIDADGPDNCKFEFDRALAQKTDKNILCVVMEEKYRNPASWFGKLKDTMGKCLCVSMDGNLNDKHYIKQQLQQITDQLKLMGVPPSQTKNKCENCMIIDKNGSQQSFYSDGDACTYCANILQKTTEPKNYCNVCQLYANGSFCSICKLNLLDKNQRINDLEEQLLGVIFLDSNANVAKYDVQSFATSIEEMKKNIIDTQSKRSEIESSGVKLQISNSEYDAKVEGLLKKMESILGNTSALNTAKDEILQSLEPSYNEDMARLESTMRSLEDKRKELDERAGQLSQAIEELQQLDNQVSEFAKDAMEGVEYVHDKQCTCDDCTFERELTYQLISNGQQYLKFLIAEDRIHQVRTAIELKGDVLTNIIDDTNEFNLLLSLTVQFGSAQMLTMLLENGLTGDAINSYNNTLLHMSIDRKDAAMIQILLYKYGDVLLEVKDRNGFTPLIKAHQTDHELLKLIKPFVKDADEQIENLQEIVQGFEFVGAMYTEDLIRNNNDVNSTRMLLAVRPKVLTMKEDYHGFTPFLQCCAWGSIEMLKVMFDHGCDIDDRDKNGDNGLSVAVLRNNTEWCKEVVEYLCDNHPKFFSDECKKGNTVLHHAADKNREDLVPILLRYLPSPALLKKVNKNGFRAPMDLCKKEGEIHLLFEEYLEFNQ